jgi:type IV secretory pathway TraG/TraD family ATPase VirD4
LWLIVDEARAMGYCNAVMDANNELRSARVSTLLCFLSMSDIERTYGQDAENLMSQSVNVVFGGSNDMAYYKYMSERLGPRTEYSEGESEQEGRTGRSRHEISVPLMRPDQLGRLPYEKCVVTVGGMNIMADKLFKAFDRNGKRWVEYF